MEAAQALWGVDAVALARNDLEPEPITPELVEEIRSRAACPGLFRTWALGQPWPVFCAVVRLVAGDTRRELMGDDMAKSENKNMVIAVRVTPEQMEKLDEYREQMGRLFPGSDMSRSAIVRMLAMQGLDALKVKAKARGQA